MSELVFSPAKFEDRYEDIKQFFGLHWQETKTTAETSELKVDYNRYLALEQAGMLYFVVAKSAVNNQIVGYFVGILAPTTIHPNELWCLTDHYFLAPNFRKWNNGQKFIKFVEADLKGRGLSGLKIMTRPNLNRGKVLERLGYSEMEIVYFKKFKS